MQLKKSKVEKKNTIRPKLKKNNNSHKLNTIIATLLKNKNKYHKKKLNL